MVNTTQTFRSYYWLLIAFCTFYFTSAKSATITGVVTDVISKELLAGAVISVKSDAVTLNTATNLEGKYTINKLPDGVYKFTCRYVGYQKQEKFITIKGGVQTIDFSLSQSQTGLQEVTIKSAKVSRGSDAAARLLEKNASQVVNIISAKSMQLLPDITVANVMQRVSGVVIDRSNTGEGRYPVIRGMDKRYNTTLVNGIKIPSPDNNNRYVPLDLFPSELLDRLEVIKSLTPSMEGDAIGGTINLVMKDAPPRLFVQANASVGYSTIFGSQLFASFDHSVINKKSPAELYGSGYVATGKDFPLQNLVYKNINNPINTTYGLSIGNRFGKDKKWGAIFSGSYQDVYRGTNSSYFFPNPQPALNNTPVFQDIFLRKYSTENKRVGLYAKLDYVIKSKQKISWYNMYIRTDDYQARNSVDSVLAIQRTGPGDGNVYVENRSTWVIQDIFSSTLHGENALGKTLNLDWSAVYSAAKKQVPDQATYSTLHSITTNTDGTTTTSQTILDPGMTREWFHNTDHDLSAYVNLIYTPKVFSRPAEFKTGGLLRHKTRYNYDNPYSLTAVQTTNNGQPYTDILNAQYAFSGSNTGTSGEVNANTYNITENIDAGYIQGKIALTSQLEALGGMRIEHTNNHYETVLGPDVYARSGTIWYNDVLPSAQLKYDLNSQQSLRLAYYKAISRPGYFEIVPTNVLGEYYNIGGNVNLNRSKADNLDLRYEFFPGGASQFLLGTFYKYINDPIEYSVIRTGVNGATQVLQPNNFGDATNYGLEAVVTKYIGNFGASLNYTYTHSRITTDKQYYYRDGNGQITNKIISQSRPLQGQADHIGNASIFYKNFKTGLDIQLAYVYTGARIIQLSPYYGLDYWQKPFSQLDFSIEKKFMKKFSVYAKVNNITNSPTKVEIRQPNTFLSGRYLLPLQESANSILVQKDFYKPAFLAGLRYFIN